MNKNILSIVCLLTMLLFSSVSATAFAQPISIGSSPDVTQHSLSTTNATITDLPTLPSLSIPSINNTEEDSKSPTLPAFDPAKATPCNVTQVNEQRAKAPIRDEDHYGSLYQNDSQQEPTLNRAINMAQYCIQINRITGVRGVAATQWIDTSYRAPSHVTLYAPTLKCPSPCPLEVSTVYDGIHNVYMIGVWDFSLGISDWAHYLYFSQAQNYISSYDGQQYYQVRICEDANGDWGAFLYNFASATWDEIYVQSSDSGDRDGWDMYEAKWNLGTDWPATLNVRSSNFQLYVWDIIHGYIWVQNYWGNPYAFQADVNTGPLIASGNYFGYLALCDDWYAGAFYVQAITFEGGLSGQGNAWDGYKLKGPMNDDQFARIYAGNYGDAGGITAKMIRETYGNIYVNGYGLDGYYNSHLYCYVSQDGQNWNLVGGGPQTINYWDGRYDIYFGYSGNFKYIAFAGFDDNGFSVNLCLDHVFIYR